MKYSTGLFKLVSKKRTIRDICSWWPQSLVSSAIPNRHIFIFEHRWNLSKDYIMYWLYYVILCSNTCVEAFLGPFSKWLDIKYITLSYFLNKETSSRKIPLLLLSSFLLWLLNGWPYLPRKIVKSIIRTKYVRFCIRLASLCFKFYFLALSKTLSIDFPEI